MINAKEAKAISEKTFNEDLFNEYLEKLDFLIRRKSLKNKTSVSIEVAEEKYAIELVKTLKENGYSAKYVLGNYFGNNKAIYTVYCQWN